MIKDLADGRTFAELLAILADTPKELGDLYARAILRSRQHTTAARFEGGHETYIVLQIAACAFAPLYMFHILEMCQEMLSGEPDHLEIYRLSVNQQERRLNSLSCGLLEPMKQQAYPLVHFIHHTVKGYLLSQAGQAFLNANFAGQPLDDGHMMIMKSISRSEGSSDSSKEIPLSARAFIAAWRTREVFEQRDFNSHID